MTDPTTNWTKTKYKIVMRLADRWAMEALQADMAPARYCDQKFDKYREHTNNWSEHSRIILTAFVIREYCVYRQFLHD